MGVVEDVFLKSPKEVSLEDIQKLINERREETHNLEYKAPDILKKPHEFSEWVSAFLNADGGLIVLGLCESDASKKNNIEAKIYPVKIEFVGKAYPKERIEQLIFGNIGCSSRPDIRIYPVRDSDDISRTVFLIEVPKGDNPPYQAQNKKYYRRLNAIKYEMSHSEIADFFGKRRKPKLSVVCRVVDPKKVDKRLVEFAVKQGSVGVSTLRSSYRLQLLVKNLGHAAAKHSRVIVSFEEIDIVKVISGPNVRIDDLRNDVPTLQWNDSSGIIYAEPKFADVIWDLQVRLHKGRWGLIAWEAIAEEMDSVKGSCVLLGEEFAVPNRDISPYYLPTYEESWGSSERRKDSSAPQ